MRREDKSRPLFRRVRCPRRVHRYQDWEQPYVIDGSCWREWNQIKQRKEPY